MADRSTRLIQDALARAAAEPAGLPLFTGRGGPGLFPGTAAARPLARRCQDDGLLAMRPEGTGRTARELAVITDKGLDWLAAQSSPKQVLEDFLRVLEERQGQVAELVTAAKQMAAGLQSLRAAVERLSPPGDVQAHHATPATGEVNPARQGGGGPFGDTTDHPHPDGWGSPADGDIVALLDEWHAASSGDCPLPELYRRLAARHPGLTVGQFHDLLRSLHDAGRVYLHPWTGPLYEMPEPPYALLAGHLIAYYASPRLPLAALQA